MAGQSGGRQDWECPGQLPGWMGQRDDCTALGRVHIGNLEFVPGKGGVQTVPRSI